jgi:hypothetical protein
MKYKRLIKKNQVLVPGLIVISTIAIAAGVLFSDPSRAITSPLKNNPPTAMQGPQISVMVQQDAPIRISLVKSDTATPTTPEVQVTIENVSTTPIRAYTVRYETISERSKAGGAELSNKETLESVLKPSQTETKILGDATYSDPVKKVILSIDFVEFIDGTTWGPDVARSRERLAGLRYGAQRTARHFRRILKEQGPQAVVEAMNAERIDITPPSDRSPEWLEGFKGGKLHIINRIKHAFGKSGLSEIESELLRPFDASERR